MSTPAIKHTDLFDFDGYQNGIESLNKSTADFVNNTNKLISSLKGTYADLQSQLTGKKVTIVDANDAEKLKQVDSEINALSVSIKNNRDAVAGLNTANRAVSDSAAGMANNAKALQLQYASLTEEEKKNETVGGAIVKQMAAQKVASKEFSDAVSKTAKDMSATDGSYSQLSNSLLKMRNELKNMPGAFDPATGGLNQNNKAAVDLATKITDTDKAVKSMDATMGQFGRNVGNYEGAVTPLKKQLRELMVQIQQLQMAGEEDTEQFKTMVTQAGKIKLAINEAGEAVKSAGAKFLGLKAGIEVFEGITAGASVATGAMALFGNENDKFKENLIKLESAMVIMQGLQKISALLEEDSMAIRYVMNTQDKLRILNTQLQGAAESKNIVVRYAAAAAQWVLNAAMSANPIGLLLIAVAALAGIFLYLSRDTHKAAEEQIKLNEVQKLGFENLQRESGKLEEISKRETDNIENKLKLAKARGASELEVMAIENDLAMAKEKNASMQNGFYGQEVDNIAKTKAQYEDLKKYIDRLKIAKADNAKTDVITNFKTNTTTTQKVDDKDITAAEGKAENLKAIYEKAEKVREEYINKGTEFRIKKLEEERYKIEQSYKNTIALDDAALAKTKVDSKAEYDVKVKTLNDKRDIELKNVNYSAEQQQKINDETNRNIYDLTRAYNEKVAKSQISTRIDSLNAQLALTKVDSEEEFNIKKKLIDEQAKLDDISAKYSINNEDEKQAKIIEIQNNHNRAILDATKAYNEKVSKSEIDTKISGLNYALSLSKTNSREELNIKKQLVDEQAKMDVLSEENSTNSEKEKAAKIKEIYGKANREKEDMDKALLKSELEQNQELIKLKKESVKIENEKTAIDPNKSGFEKRAAIKANQEAELQGYADDLAFYKDNKLALFNTDEEYEIKKTEVENQQAEARVKIAQKEQEDKTARLNAAFKFAGDIGQSLTDISKNQSDARIDALNAEKDKAIAAAGDNANAKTRIENEYAHKINKEKAKQAKLDKENALFQIAINTAMGVSSATSTGPLGMFLIPLIIATGLLEAAVVMSKPLPAYRRGTRNAPEGMAIVNDEPGGNFQETIQRDGKLYMPKGRNSVVNLKRGDKVYTATETLDIFRNVETNRISRNMGLNDELSEKLNLSRTMEVQHNMTSALESLKVNEKYIVDGIGNHIANMPQSIQNWDENGYRKATRRGNTIIHDQNKSNSL